MKKKKGFTLVEIIVTIALLGLIGSIIAVNVVGLSKKQEDKEIERVRSTLQAAAEGYAENKGIEEGCVKDTVLIEGGWLKGNTLPQDKHYSVKIKKDGAEKKYTVHEGENCQGEQIRETQKKYTITYIEEGEQTKTETVISGQDYEVKAPNNNSNFDGWLDTQTGETYDKEYTIKNVKSNKTLVAKRTQGQYLIKYYDGKTLKKVETVSQGKTYKIAEKIKKDKYEFKGWKEKNASKIYQPGNIVNNVQKDITLEAQWGAKVKINVVNGTVNTTTNGNNGEYTLEPNATGTFTVKANEGYILDDYTCSPQAETITPNADRTSLRLTIKKPTSCTVRFKEEAVNLTLRVPAQFGYDMKDIKAIFGEEIGRDNIKLDNMHFNITLPIKKETQIDGQKIAILGSQILRWTSMYHTYRNYGDLIATENGKKTGYSNYRTAYKEEDNFYCGINNTDIEFKLKDYSQLDDEITCDLTSDTYVYYSLGIMDIGSVMLVENNCDTKKPNTCSGLNTYSIQARGAGVSDTDSSNNHSTNSSEGDTASLYMLQGMPGLRNNVSSYGYFKLLFNRGIVNTPNNNSAINFMNTLGNVDIDYSYSYYITSSKTQSGGTLSLDFNSVYDNFEISDFDFYDDILVPVYADARDIYCPMNSGGIRTCASAQIDMGDFYVQYDYDDVPDSGSEEWDDCYYCDKWIGEGQNEECEHWGYHYGWPGC